MTIDDLKKCKTDEQGRAMVTHRIAPNSAHGSVLATFGECAWVLWDKYPTSPCTYALKELCPAPPSPHAELVKELKGLAHALDACDFKYRAAVIRRAIAALEADTAEGGK